MGEMRGNHDPSRTADRDGSAILVSEYVTIIADCLNISPKHAMCYTGMQKEEPLA